MRIAQPFLRLALVVELALGGASVAGAEEHASQLAPNTSQDLTTYVPGAAELEGQVIAPCCWTQTIDIHGSPISTELRHEIRTRLRAGEAVDAIRGSLVARYGEKVLAVPKGSRLGSAGLFLVLGMAGAGFGAFSLLRRWQRRSTGKGGPGATEDKSDKSGPKRDVPDERVDAEIARLDGD